MHEPKTVVNKQLLYQFFLTVENIDSKSFLVIENGRFPTNTFFELNSMAIRVLSRANHWINALFC